MLPILRNIVRYHIALSAVLYSANIPMGTSSVLVANNATLMVVKTGNVITVNGVNVTRVDILAANGVIQVLQGIVIPNMYDFSILRALARVNASRLLNAIDSSMVIGPYLVTTVSLYYCFFSSIRPNSYWF